MFIFALGVIKIKPFFVYQRKKIDIIIIIHRKGNAHTSIVHHFLTFALISYAIVQYKVVVSLSSFRFFNFSYILDLWTSSFISLKNAVHATANIAQTPQEVRIITVFSSLYGFFLFFVLFYALFVVLKRSAAIL